MPVQMAEVGSRRLRIGPLLFCHSKYIKWSVLPWERTGGYLTSYASVNRGSILNIGSCRRKSSAMPCHARPPELPHKPYMKCNGRD